MLVYIIMLIKILIGVFICLIGYQIIITVFNKGSDLYEGLENNTTASGTETASGTDSGTGTGTGEYKAYNTNDPNNSLILAQQNAGNIEVINGRMSKLEGVKERVDTLQQSIDSMQTQIDGLVQQQADYAKDVMGTEPPSLEGTEEYTAEDVEEEEDTST
jgi:hypothetical protein